MAAAKGKIKTGGRVAGTTNRLSGPNKIISKELMLEAFMYAARSLQKDIDQLSPLERTNFVLRAAAHFIPRLETIKPEEGSGDKLKVRVIVLGARSDQE